MKIQSHCRKRHKSRKSQNLKNKSYNLTTLTDSLNNTNRNLFFIFRKKIKLTNNNSTATILEHDYFSELGLVEGVVLKKGSSIRFKI